MLRYKEMISLDEYVEIFDKKFSNFCSKNILSLEYSIIHNIVTIHDDSGYMMEPIEYEIDIKVPIRSAIHEIADELKKYYPKFYGFYEKKMTAEEIGVLLRNHTPNEIEELAHQKDKVLEYTIYRVVNQHNEISVIDHMDYNTKKVYKLTIPAIEFVNLLYTDIDTAKEVFLKRSKFIQRI